MPFGLLKLKKSKNYSVVSKSLCVIIVKLLENGTVECILSSRTLGHECLDNVCQRLQIAQTEYFGLRYATKDGSIRWVDLDRPLKKQLDKYAQEFSLSLGIMFYVFNVDHLSDEPTRYYYFSHLKGDILEGRLRCNREEAIQLASFSLQAEFGDHRPEHHTPEYLKNFVLVPKYLTGVAGGNQGDQLLEEIIKAHQSLHGTPHAVAELYYLMAVQRLEGYGEELFKVKDQIGHDVTLGVSALGVTVRYPSRIQQEQAMAYQWSEIVDLIHHKKFFKIEGRHANCCAQFQLDDVITAKYIWKQCVQQHKFYMQMKQLEADSNGNAGATGTGTTGLGVNKDKEVIKNQHAINESPVRSSLISQNNNNHNTSNNNNHTNNNNNNSNSHSLGSLDDLDSGVYNTETQRSHLGQGQPSVTGQQMAPTPPCPTPRVSTPGSGLSMGQIMASSSMVAKEEPDYENVSMLLANSEEVRRALLPEYRKAPDYEQAIRMKYQISASLNDLSYGSSTHRYHHNPQGHQHIHHNRLYGNYASSIPSSNIDISPTSKSYNPLMPLNSYSQYGQYSTDLQAIGNSSQELVGVYSRQMAKTNSNLPPYQTAMHTQYSSTPELNLNTVDRRQSTVLPGARDLYPIQARVAVTTSTARGTSTSVPDLTQSLGSRHSPSVQMQITTDGVGQPQLQHADPSRSRLSSDSSSTHTSAHTPLQSARYTSSSNNPMNNNTNGNNSKPSTPSTATTVTVNNQRVAYQSYNNSETSTKEANITKVQVTSTNSSDATTPVDGMGAGAATSWPAEPHSLSSNVLTGPMLMAAMNGLAGPTVKPDILENVHDGVMVEKVMDEPPKDSRIQDLETKLAGGHVFQEFEQIVKKKPMANFATAMLSENMPRNRFKDVLPYEENRVRLGPSKDNRTGYINASHVSVSIGEMHRFYIAAQGPMANTCFHFWQMIWENNTAIIVMLTDVVESGKEKCHPYWPQADDSRVTFKDFVVTRKTTCVSSTFTTCALQVQYLPTRVTRTVYHLQYTDWPDHGCPMDIHGFLSFMEEIESVRRLVLSEQNLAQNRAVRNAPVVMHCTAGVGRSGVVILCDLLLFCLDHNHPIDVPQALTYIRYQRMLSVQTLAQYKFVYHVLIQYLKNSRLI